MNLNPSELADDPPPAWPLSLLINVTSLQARADLDREDVNVAGVYRVDLDFDAAEHQTLAKRASMALDIFHSSVAIAVLDDFCITVINPQDRAEVAQDPEHEDYSESDSGVAYKMRDVPF